MAFLPEAQLCDLLHKLPSEIDAEDGLKIVQLLVYFGAKGRHEKEQQAMARANAEMGGY